MKQKMLLGAVAAAAALALAGCGAAPSSNSANGGGGAPAGGKFLACMVSDSGGFNDHSFNETSYAGLQKAVKDLGVKEATAQSTSDADYAPNVDSMVQQGCNLVIGVGYLLEESVQAAAKANPKTHFALVDSAFKAKDFSPVKLDNGKPLVFNTAEAAYLAGYLAAGMSKTKTVATFGGQQLPTVAIFMDGFADGVKKYNEDNKASVKLLGWNKDTQNGSFTGDFENQDNGKALTEQFLAQGADIIMPVAGPVGLGAATAIEAKPGAMMIWVDSDGFVTTSYGKIILTSVMKTMDVAVHDVIKQASEGKYTADPYIGTLKNGGVNIAPFHDFDSKVPADLKKKVDDLKKQIIDGKIVVETPNKP